MGAGIAQSLAVAGCHVLLTDLDEGVLARAREAMRSGRFGLDSAVQRGKLGADEAEQAAKRVTYVTDLAASEGLHDIGLAVEAVPEDLALKVTVFRRLDALLPARAILASNSSGFAIAALAAATDRPDRVIGWHWASPAPVMRLAEIVRTAQTSAETVERVERLARRAGKNPVVVNDAPTNWGYVANRVYAAAYREASRVVEEGVATPEQVDRLLVDCFRWPAGPFGMTSGAGSGWSN